MNNAKSIRLLQAAWYGDSEVELDFPASWEVIECRMKGHHLPRLSDSQVRQAFANPIGSITIRKLAKGKKEVAILFDDLTRPTPVADVVPYVLEELAGEVADEHIRFIAAIGCHRALTRIDFVKKLGAEVVDRFPVYNHNPWENCIHVGKTSQGTPVSINREVMSCDLRIGIGSITPHGACAFTGGGKILIPGVASMDSITANHILPAQAKQRGRSGSMTYGIGFEDNEMRLDIAEAAELGGLEVKVDAVLNIRREVVGLFVGAPRAEQEEGVKLAGEVYATPAVAGADIVIANAFSKGTEPFLAIAVGAKLLPESGGDLVVIVNNPEGIIPHYLTGSWGTEYGGRYWHRRRRLLPRVNRLIVFSQYLDRAQAVCLAPPEQTVVVRSWAEVVDQLSKGHPDRTRVAVIPDATTQFFPE